MKKRIVAIAGLALAVGGCATVMAGTTQDIRITSDPSGAKCRIERDGTAIAMVTTPATTNVPRSKRDLLVTCSKEGLADATEVIPSVLHGGTVGNVIAGGLIGVAVDAASGANNNYNEVTIVSLAPASFDNDAAREAYYAGQRARIAATADAEVKRIMDSCMQSKREFCAIEAKRTEDSRARALASLDSKRQAGK